MRGRGAPSKKEVAKKKASTADVIEKIKRDREERRRSMENYRRERAAEAARNEREGRPGDVDFQRMINKWRRDNAGTARKHVPPGKMKICIAVRKRPINSKEVARKDFDSVTALNPRVMVHSCKYRVDGITKFLENQSYEFDHTFGEADSTEDVYRFTVMPLVAYAFRGGRGTCFAYGQTGSGKTYTMVGVQEMVVRDLVRLSSSDAHRASRLRFSVSYFEIYGGRCLDLLNNRALVKILEDRTGTVQAVGLCEEECTDAESLLASIARGNDARTTHSTEMNDVSSRSHAICEIAIRDPTGRAKGKINLIDLAGSERAADTRHHNRQRRRESAEINKSLLALKECIRALDAGNAHVPFRACKLTLVLKDSFTSKNARVCMIATVSPAASAADHTANTLRYADRVKDKPQGRGGSTVAKAVGAGGPASVELQYLDDVPSAARRPTAVWEGRATPIVNEEEEEEEEEEEDDGGFEGEAEKRRAQREAIRAKAEAEREERRLAREALKKKHRQKKEQEERKAVPKLAIVDRRARGAWGEQVREEDSEEEEEENFEEGADEIFEEEADENPSSSPPPPPPPAPVASASVPVVDKKKEERKGSTKGVGGTEAAARERVRARMRADAAAVLRRSERTDRRGGEGGGGGKEEEEEEEEGFLGDAAAESKVVSSPSKKYRHPHRSSKPRKKSDAAPSSPGARAERLVGDRVRHQEEDSVDMGMEDEEDDFEGDDDDGVASDFHSLRNKPPTTKKSPSSKKSPSTKKSASSKKHQLLTPRAKTRPDGDDAGPSPQEDMRMLGETLAREGGKGAQDSGRWLAFHEVMDRIVEEEDALLTAHMGSIQDNAKMLTQEGELLQRIQGADVVDYDIDGYAASLEDILNARLTLTQNLLLQLRSFRKHLALEDELAHNHSEQALPVPWGAETPQK